MSHLQQSSRQVTLLTLYGVALGIAVAIWGAIYKIEQYPLRGLTFRVMAPAKLLTEKERPQSAGIMWTGPAATGDRSQLGHLPAWTTDIGRSVIDAGPPGVLVPATRPRKIAQPKFTYLFCRPPPSRFTS